MGRARRADGAWKVRDEAMGERKSQRKINL